MEEKAKNDHGMQTKEYELAGLMDRFAANIIDSFLLILPIMIVIAVIGSSVPSADDGRTSQSQR